MATSTIQEYTDALIANLQKRSVLSTVTIVDGPPTVDQNSIGEWIMFGDVDGSQSFATINSTTKPKDETFTIQVWIDVVHASDSDQTTISRRAIALLAEIENELRANPAQGVTHVLWSQVKSPLRLTKNSSDMWREAWIATGIEVRSRI